MQQPSQTPDSPPQEELATAGRSEERDSLLLSANLRLDADGSVHAVRVRNLSGGGVMAEHEGPVEVGDRVQIEIRNIGWVKGRIAWATDGRLGIAFDRQVDPKKARNPMSKAKKAK